MGASQLGCNQTAAGPLGPNKFCHFDLLADNLVLKLPGRAVIGWGVCSANKYVCQSEWATSCVMDIIHREKLCPSTSLEGAPQEYSAKGHILWLQIPVADPEIILHINVRKNHCFGAYSW